MNTTSPVRFMLGLIALLSFVTVTYAGGGDVVTLKEFPDFAVVGQPLNLTFTVWVPSLEPLADLQPNIRATNSNGVIAKGTVKTSAATGEYTAALILPEPGDWVITFDTEYIGASTLPPLKVIAPGTPPPAPLASEVRGSRLFNAKGCSACHLREGVGRIYGPDLTGKQFAPVYLRQFLADPSITPVPEEVCNRDRSFCGSPYAMPNLNLKNAEIEALIVFINK